MWNSEGRVTGWLGANSQFLTAAVFFLADLGLTPWYIPVLARLMQPLLAHKSPLALPVLLMLSLALTGITLAVSLAVIIRTTCICSRAMESALLTVAFGGLWAVMLFEAPPRLHGPVTALYQSVAYLCLAIAASFLGRLIAAAFKDQNLVAPAALAAGAMDYWGVFFGTTRDIVAHHSHLVQHISVPVPALVPELAMQIGPGDYVFLGLMFALLHRFEMPALRTAVVMFVLMLVAAALVMLRGMSIPGVVPMGLAVLAVNARCFHFKRAEWFAMAYAGLLLLALMGLWWAMHGH
jgi:hypothetical protein